MPNRCCHYLSQWELLLPYFKKSVFAHSLSWCVCLALQCLCLCFPDLGHSVVSPVLGVACVPCTFVFMAADVTRPCGVWNCRQPRDMRAETRPTPTTLILTHSGVGWLCWRFYVRWLPLYYKPLFLF